MFKKQDLIFYLNNFLKTVIKSKQGVECINSKQQQKFYNLQKKFKKEILKC